MGKDATLIYGGGGDVTLYDATNGYYSLGYLSELSYVGDPALTPTVRGQNFQFLTIYKLTVRNLQTNQALLTELKNRRTLDQTIYIAGAGKLYTLSNMAISYGYQAPHNTSDPHAFVLTAQTGVEHSMAENLFGAVGKFENDTNSDGLADGWAEGGTLDGKSILSSHLAGGGNAQQIDVTAGNTASINETILAPFISPMKVTFSFYAKARTASQFNTRLVIYDTGGSTIQTKNKSFSMTLNEETRQEHSVWLDPGGTLVKNIQAYIMGDGSNAADLLIDNAQLEFASAARTFRDE